MDDAEAEWMSSGYNQCYYRGPLQKGWGLVHRMMERPFDRTCDHSKVLELGAGHGQHFSYVRHGFRTYLMTDINQALLSEAPEQAGVIKERLDANDLGRFESDMFDRLIATCLLAHLHDPIGALKSWRRVVKPGGWLTIYVPAEPSLVNRVVRRVYIWPRSRKFGAKDPEFTMYSGHMIHYPAMRTFVERVFQEDHVVRSRFPHKILPWNLTFFEIYQIQKRI